LELNLKKMAQGNSLNALRKEEQEMKKEPAEMESVDGSELRGDIVTVTTKRHKTSYFFFWYRDWVGALHF
jgi:hypothetical protein